MANKPKPPGITALRWAALGILLALLVLPALFASPSGGDKNLGSLTESKLYSQLSTNPKSVDHLKFDNQVVDVYSSKTDYKTVNVPDESDRTNLRALALKNDIKFDTSAPASGGSVIGSLLGLLFPIIMIGLLIWFMRKGMGGAGQLGKLKGKVQAEENTAGVTFADVIGAGEAKEDLFEIVEFMKDPSKAKREGINIPRGVLLEGPPGTGKTLLARAVAGEAGVPFFNMSGSEFVEMFVGLGASRVRDLFAGAKACGKAIIFIDEIDAVGRKRGSGVGNGHDEREQTLNQILTEMDGFDEKADNGTFVLVIAATNRADVLDDALLRPGRFTRRVQVELPTVDDRQAMFNYYLRKGDAKLSSTVNVRELANTTTGMSGADIANVVNEARVMRLRRTTEAGKVVNLDTIATPVDPDLTWSDFDKAISKVKYGPERKSFHMDDDTKQKVIVHEAGHGTVAYELLGPNSLRKATIIPTGKALGYFEWLTDGDKPLYSEQDCLNIITIAVAGRVSQQHFLGGAQRDSGVASDYQQAWGLARRMVAEWGMSDLGILFAPAQEHSMFGTVGGGDISDQTKRDIEDESRKIIATCEQRAEEIIAKHESQMRVLFTELSAAETLSGDQIRAILGANPAEDDATDQQ